MAIQILTGKQRRPRKAMIYGTNWAGKSKTACDARGIFMLDLEAGLDDFDVIKTGRLRSYEDVLESIGWVANEGVKDHGVEWLGIDTVDWLERLIQAKVTADHGAESFGADCFSYGKGRKFCLPYWQEVMTWLDRLADVCGVGVVLLAHNKATKIVPPDAPEYQRNVPALDDEARQILCDWCDEIFFMDFRTALASVDTGFNKTRQIAAKGAQQRFTQTTPSAGTVAKNRLNMPGEIDNFTWDHYAAAIEGSYAAATSEGGVQAQ